MKIRVLICLLSVVAMASAVPAESPVTRGELDAVLRKAEAAIAGVLRLQAGIPKLIPAQKKGPEQTKTATRAEAIAGFNRLFELAKPKFKFTPKPIRVDVSKLSLPADSVAREQLLKLIRWGCIPTTGPVSCGKKEALLPDELGDALGWLICRIAELTHAPDIEYSPYLTPDGE